MSANITPPYAVSTVNGRQFSTLIRTYCDALVYCGRFVLISVQSNEISVQYFLKIKYTHRLVKCFLDKLYVFLPLSVLCDFRLLSMKYTVQKIQIKQHQKQNQVDVLRRNSLVSLLYYTKFTFHKKATFIFSLLSKSTINQGQLTLQNINVSRGKISKTSTIIMYKQVH